MSKLSEYPLTFYVVENTGRTKSLLDTIDNVHMVYTDTNNTNHYLNENGEPYRKNGTNELIDIKHVATQFQFEDNDIVIKLTGRYTIQTPLFVEIVQEYKEKYDAFIKFFDVCGNKFRYDDCVLGYYAIRYNVLKAINTAAFSLDNSPEHAFATYIRDNVAKERISEIKFLDMYFRKMESMHL